MEDNVNIIGNYIAEAKYPNLVTIIIPTYNRAFLLAETLDTVINQSYRPIECIIIDDGSTDNTKQLVNVYMEENCDKDLKIIYKNQVNSGAPAARNLGTKIASGAYIQYLDSDDLLYPDKIREQVNYLKKHQTCDGVFGDWEHGTLEKKVIINGQKDEDMIAQFYGGRVIHTLSFLFTRNIIEKIGEWDINLKRNQEIDFHLRGVLVGGKFDYHPLITGLWREHEGERIVTTNGTYYSLLYHEKWIKKFKELNMLSPQIKRLASLHLFYMANDLSLKFYLTKIKFIKWAYHLNPTISELNTIRFQNLKKIFGLYSTIALWIVYAKYSQTKTHNKYRQNP